MYYICFSELCRGKLGVVTVLGAIGIKEYVDRMLARAPISSDAADTSRIPAAVVVCCTSQLIRDARLQALYSPIHLCGHPLTIVSHETPTTVMSGSLICHAVNCSQYRDHTLLKNGNYYSWQSNSIKHSHRFIGLAYGDGGSKILQGVNNIQP